MEFTKKRSLDNFYAGLLIVMTTGLVGTALYFTKQGAEFYIALVFSVLLVGVLLVIIMQDAKTKYILEEDRLTVKTGLSKYSILYKDIEIISVIEDSEDNAIIFNSSTSLKPFFTVSPVEYESFKEEFYKKL